MLGISKALLSNILNYRRDLSIDVALRIEAYLDIPADFLMNMQLSHRIKEAKKGEGLFSRINRPKPASTMDPSNNE